jgi:hypothetical protein
MNFAAQPLTTTAHHDVGKLTMGNVPVYRALADAQSRSGIIKCQ